VTPLRTVSVAAPAYNEAAQLRPLIEEWLTFLGARYAGDAYEIVVCDDGSRDDTWNVLSDLARVHPAVKPVRHAVNQGAAAALATAIAHTTKDWVLLLDADGQYPIENLERFAQALERDDSPAFIGARPRKADGMVARFGSWASGWLCNRFHGTRYRDFNCALKLVDGALLRSLVLEAKGLNYSTEISSKILERGVRMREVEILHAPRRGGRSSRTLVRGSVQRFLFVALIGVRQLLFKLQVLQRRPYDAGADRAGGAP